MVLSTTAPICSRKRLSRKIAPILHSLWDCAIWGSILFERTKKTFLLCSDHWCTSAVEYDSSWWIPLLHLDIETFSITRPKPAYGRQGLDWIVGPGYSFVVFSTNKTIETNQKLWKTMENHETTLKNHKTQPKTMKNHETTLKNNGNQPKTMKNHETTL